MVFAADGTDDLCGDSPDSWLPRRIRVYRQSGQASSRDSLVFIAKYTTMPSTGCP